MTDRELRPLADGEVLDLGRHRLRWIDTPHVPGPWESGVMFDVATRTLFCGDLFSRTQAPAITHDDVANAAIAHDQLITATPTHQQPVRRCDTELERVS